MIYLDYSATTKPDNEVLELFLENIDNPNISYEQQQKKVQKLLNTTKEVIYTSGATESNNLAIKGITKKYEKLKETYHIITTELEHSSILEQMKYLEAKNFIIDYVELDENGRVSLENLEKLITEQTILVSIASVNSETGILQPIEQIGAFLKKYPHIIFHSDMTQSIGKIDIDLKNIDLISFTAHKFYGLKGIGCLLKEQNINLEPLLYDDSSLNLSLVMSLTKALELSLKDKEEKYNYVKKQNTYLKEQLSTIPNIKINSNNYSIPHILNISILTFKPETFQHTLELEDIYISTKSACSNTNTISKAVFALTKDKKLSSSSVRISISHKTTKEEIKKFIKIVKNVCK